MLDRSRHDDHVTTARARGAAEGSSLHSPRPKPHECHQPEPCHGATARTTRNRAAQYGKPAVAGELMRDGAVDGSSATRLVALAWPARGARAARDRERAPRAARYGSCSVREKAARHRLGTGAARYGSSQRRMHGRRRLLPKRYRRVHDRGTALSPARREVAAGSSQLEAHDTRPAGKPPTAGALGQPLHE